MLWQRLSIGLLAVGIATGCIAADSQREAAIAEVLQQPKVGQQVSLDAAGQAFIALYTPSERLPEKAAVLILHDTGGFPDQQPLIALLRSEFPQHHMASLALQMPLREQGASEADYYPLFPEAVARIQAGIAFLKKKDSKRIFLLGHGLGSLMGLSAELEKPLDVKALVLISLPVPAADSNIHTLDMLKKLKLPVLDVYAERDLAEVVNSARDKRVATNANPAYRQLRIDNEDHLFKTQAGLLSKRIYSWLSQLPLEPPPPTPTSTPSPASAPSAEPSPKPAG